MVSHVHAWILISLSFLIFKYKLVISKRCCCCFSWSYFIMSLQFYSSHLACFFCPWLKNIIAGVMLCWFGIIFLLHTSADSFHFYNLSIHAMCIQWTNERIRMLCFYLFECTSKDFLMFTLLAFWSTRKWAVFLFLSVVLHCYKKQHELQL